MSAWRLLTLICAISILVETKSHHKRDANIDLCDDTQANDVQCYCYKHKSAGNVADCYLSTDNVKPEDKIWEAFDKLQTTSKITLTNSRGKTLKYIPNKALKLMRKLTKLYIKFANLQNIPAYVFSNSSIIEEIDLQDNQIKSVEKNAFANHAHLKILSLDENKIVEINRDVFVNLPSLEKLFLTRNQITTIHDRAFIHLTHLKDLEINRNKLFSLNVESFAGLQHLVRLDLYANSLEIIGDNTFLPLTNLRSLNLENNKIEMLDDGAFNGLSKLESLSLARNKLTVLTNEKNFQGLASLKTLNLQGNQIREFKFDVVQPIFQNFIEPYSTFDIEDNNFPCTCQLDWFLDLMLSTRNNRTKLALNNLKCEPDEDLRLTYDKAIEKQKAEEKDMKTSDANDDEYYDETQLGGKLFYIDLRDLLNCSRTDLNNIALDDENEPQIQTTPQPNLKPATQYRSTTHNPVSTTTLRPVKVTSQGVQELSLDDATVKTTNNPNDPNNLYTTTRLATVSAKPKRNDVVESISKKTIYDENDMASDEAQPESSKGHKRDYHTDQMPKNSSQRNYSCAFLLLLTFLCKTYF